MFFLLPAESAHHLVSVLIRILHAIPGFSQIIRSIYSIRDSRLEKELFGIRFPNPVGMAAGFDKEGRLYQHLACYGFGHIEIGTVTPRPQPGNPKPRLFRLVGDQALINRMGFNNLGVDAMVKQLRKKEKGLIVGGNIGKNTSTPNELATRDYTECFETLYDWVDYFVINVSCPNIENLSRLQDKDQLSDLLQRIMTLNSQKGDPKPVLLKIAPDLNHTQLDEIIELVVLHGLSGIVATNTTTQRDKLNTPEKTIKSIGNGGLSGMPLFEKSIRVVSYIHQKSGGSIPVIAVGGIFTPVQARAMIDAGASLIQVYTGFIYEGPGLIRRICKHLLASGSNQV